MVTESRRGVTYSLQPHVKVIHIHIYPLYPHQVSNHNVFKSLCMMVCLQAELEEMISSHFSYVASVLNETGVIYPDAHYSTDIAYSRLGE